MCDCTQLIPAPVHCEILVQREARAAKDLASSSAAQAAGAQADQQGLQQLQEQLLASQEALKAAKAESARRLKSLQSLQQQVGLVMHSNETFRLVVSTMHQHDGA